MYKFRGKSKYEDRWVYGDLVTGPGYRGIAEFSKSCTLKTTYEVHPESVGQWTGLKDKNGEGDEIYQNDCLEIDGVICLVDWLDGGFVLIGEGFNGECIGPQVSYGYVEIVGNAYDNPELLKGT